MIIKIIGIDPGIHNCGVALGEFNTDTNHLVIKDFFTIHASELARKANKKDSNAYGSIFSLFLLEQEFTTIFTNFTPDYVASEDAFYNPRTPNAYASLKGCILSIKRVLYNFRLKLNLIAPKLAKMTVVKATANKNDMMTAITKLPDLTIEKDITNIVEHEADAIGIAYTLVKLLNKK
jgi:Holliday junction resolvasome RuvABC endonuclease subunit